MQKILDLLLANPWLILFIVLGILGNIGGSAAQKARRKQERDEKRRRVRELIEQRRTGNDPFAEVSAPAAEQAQPVSPVDTSQPTQPEASDDISRRIQEILGRAQGSPTAQAPSLPTARAADSTPARGGDLVGSNMDSRFESSLTRFEGGFETTDFDERAAGLTSGQGSIEKQARKKGKQRAKLRSLPLGLQPRQLIFSQIVLGRPRAEQPYGQDSLLE